MLAELNCDSSLDERAAVAVPLEHTYALFDFFRDNPPPFHAIELAWDLRRQYGADEGYEIYCDIAQWDKFETDASIAADFKSCDRAGPTQFDQLLIDAMGWARRHGWHPPAEIESIFAAIDADTHAMRLIDEKLANFRRRLRAEAEGHEVFVRAKLSVDSKDSSAMSAPSPLLAGAPGPSNASSLIGGDPATAWAEIDGHSTPITTCSDNVAVFLRRVGVALRWNAWLERIEICKPGEIWAAYSDHHFDELMTTAAGAVHRFRPSADLFRRALSTLARDEAADPAIDKLAALEKVWDGKPRLNVWLSETCGVDCDPYHQATGAAIVGGIVRRIRHPGCKFDLMPVFVGAQGVGKSTLAKLLALDSTWFTDNVPLGIESKELLPLLRGKSVVEVSEMRTRGEVDAVKAMLSRTVDEARVAYGREPIVRPRRNIFVGTTNEPEMLEDATGGRRFLPITVTREINLEWLAANVEQIVAEACVKETQGATFELPREVWSVAATHQQAARALADYEIALRHALAPEHGPQLITAAELVQAVRAATGRHVSPKQYAGTMRELGFIRTVQRMGANQVPVAVWRRGSPDAAQLVSRLPSGGAPMLPPPR